MTISATARRKAFSSRQMEQAAHKEYVKRFDVHQRVQHVLMMSSFIVLALTGLPQRFSEVGASQWWVDTLGGLENVRAIHRAAGIVMIVDCLYHVSYLFFRIGVQGRTTPLQMIPTLQDGKDAINMARYFIGAVPEKPRFGRFSYLEKFDYWAVFWGMAMIGTSGLVLTFHVAATRVLPGQVLPLAQTIHGDEAILAVGWILIVHMFNAHLAPWVFPFNPAIFTGKLSRERYEEDHPLEYARILALEERAATARAQGMPGATAHERSRTPAPATGAVLATAVTVAGAPLEGGAVRAGAMFDSPAGGLPDPGEAGGAPPPAGAGDGGASTRLLTSIAASAHSRGEAGALDRPGLAAEGEARDSEAAPAIMPATPGEADAGEDPRAGLAGERG